MTKNAFNEKGEAAEQLIGALCKDAFFEDFCFKNPYYTKGKELCDVLVVLGDVAIIWQIKNIKLKEGHFNKSDIEKAVNQCRGARRQLIKLGTASFKNVAGKDKTIETSQIKEVFLIAAIEGGTPDFNKYYDDETKSNGNVHIFLEGLTRFATKHLNTVTDFVEYLRKKEAFLASHKNIMLSGGEENLLAIYLRNNRTFGNMEDAKEVDMMWADLEGAADELENNDKEYAEKLEADHWSKGWDELIEKKRAGLMQDGSEANDPDHDKFLQKMMNHNRFERRVLGKQFFDAAVLAAEQPYVETFVYKRLVPIDDHNVTYLFLFAGDQNTPRIRRQKILYATALAAKQVMPQNDMLIAIATELHMVKTPTSSFEWVMLDMAAGEFEKECGDEARKYRDKLNIWKRPIAYQTTSWEYPSDARKKRKK
ncbi:MAG TPA: hypothetical protein VIH90_01725 [Candidatus Saccharimonadales bacterium]